MASHYVDDVTNQAIRPGHKVYIDLGDGVNGGEVVGKVIAVEHDGITLDNGRKYGETVHIEIVKED